MRVTVLLLAVGLADRDDAVPLEGRQHRVGKLAAPALATSGAAASALPAAQDASMPLAAALAPVTAMNLPRSVSARCQPLTPA